MNNEISPTEFSEFKVKLESERNDLKRYLDEIDDRIGNWLKELEKGFDLAEKDIALAKSRYPDLRLEMASVYDADIAQRFGAPFDAVVSMEVIEHLFEPRKLFEQCFRLLKEGGLLIMSTPYHGYAKNLAIAVLDQWDAHHGVEADGGHIKYFSKRTLARMAGEVGFKNLRFSGVGRFPYFWKSMILIAQK